MGFRSRWRKRRKRWRRRFKKVGRFFKKHGGKIVQGVGTVVGSIATVVPGGQAIGPAIVAGSTVAGKALTKLGNRQKFTVQDLADTGSAVAGAIGGSNAKIAVSSKVSSVSSALGAVGKVTRSVRSSAKQASSIARAVRASQKVKSSRSRGPRKRSRGRARFAIRGLSRQEQRAVSRFLSRSRRTRA